MQLYIQHTIRWVSCLFCNLFQVGVQLKFKVFLKNNKYLILNIFSKKNYFLYSFFEFYYSFIFMCTNNS